MDKTWLMAGICGAASDSGSPRMNAAILKIELAGG
jgi:hypothetical protein